eukprot:Trichotokara_eunicae@DN8061_c0_g1_i1.p1
MGNSQNTRTKNGPRRAVGASKRRREFRSNSRGSRRERDGKPSVIWIYGPTGTGKSRGAMECVQREGLSCFWKDETKWWDGYSQHDAVLLDDFRFGKSLSFVYLLRLLDRYPLTVEYKGGSVQFKSRIIIFTSPSPPRDGFEGEDVAQLYRRVDIVLEMDVERSFFVKGSIKDW